MVDAIAGECCSLGRQEPPGLCLFPLEEAEGVDEELKDSLSDCPKDTREFWAWCYGQMAGRLFIAHSYLKEAFLHEVRRSEWVEGWPVISLMVEEHVEWSEYRRTCMALYEVADVEYKGARPWNSPQPAHLSPESDLYWAMRVGFSDAHIEAAQGSAGPTPAEIGSKLDDLRQMVFASALRSMRSFQEVKRDVGSLGNAIPTAEGARNIVAGAVGEELLETLPAKTVQHLIEAWLAKQQGRPDDARVATAKAIEAIFTRLVKERLGKHVPDLKIKVTRPRGAPSIYSLGKIRYIHLGDWANILATLHRSDGPNSELGTAMVQSFPDVDLELLARCGPSLKEAARARGPSAHDSDSEGYDDRVSRAETLWSIAVGFPETPGVILRLCMALGVGPVEQQ